MADEVEGEKAKFGSTLGLYLTLLGYSMGMSDMWRFPFLAYRNGGGAFLVPFIITIVVCGIPLYFLEFGLGKFSGKGPYKVWDISPLLRGAGVTMFVAYLTYLFGTTIIRAWIFQFVFYTFQDPLPWTTCDNAWNKPTCVESNLGLIPSSEASGNVTVFGYKGDDNASQATIVNNSLSVFNFATNESISNGTLSGKGIGLSAAEEFWSYNVLALSPGLHDLAQFQWKYVAFTFVWRALVMVIAIFGLGAIEKMMYVCATFPVLISIAILVRSLMLPGAIDGLYLFFYPDMTKLFNIKIWIEAFVMGFYTLAFGWGGITTLGAHTKFKDSSIRVAVLCPILDAAMAIFQGVVCFSVLGNMAAVRGVEVEKVVEANISTGIIALVSALASLPLPQLWSLLFFISSVLSSLDTQLVPFEMLVEVMGELLPKLYSKYRVQMIVGFSALLFILGLPTCTGAGPYIFLLVDWYAGCWPGPIVALVEVIVVGWIYGDPPGLSDIDRTDIPGLDRFSNDIRIMTGKALPWFMHIGIAFTTPVFVAIIFGVSILEYIPPVYGTYVYPGWARLLGWLLVALILSPIVIVALKWIYTERGTIAQRVRRLLKPNSDWGPADEVSQAEYKKSSAKFESRPYTDLLLYNVARRYRDRTFKQQAAQEMKGLV